MKTKAMMLAGVLALGATAPSFAGQRGDAVLGGALGGLVGAAVGSSMNGQNGAVVGAALGAAAGAYIATDRDDRGYRDDRRYRSRHDGRRDHYVAYRPYDRPVHYVRYDRDDRRHGPRHRGRWDRCDD